MKISKSGNTQNKHEMDMTQGGLVSKILIFSLPLMLSGILQLLYNAADIIVVGRFAGSSSLAAVGSTGSLISLIINVFMGLSVGASAAVARSCGAKDMDSAHRTTSTAITISLVAGVCVGIFGFLMAKPLLRTMGSPDDVIDKAATYVRIFFLGTPANMLFNFGSSILRAVGDTKRPLYYLTISGLVNVLLNLFFVIVLKIDVAGVALATIISQIISATLVIVTLIKSNGYCHLDIKSLKIYSHELKIILRIGLPAGIQGSIFSISNVLIQSSINSFDSIAMAGSAAGSNIEGFIYTAMNSLSQASLSFAGQNYGAKKPDRIRKTLVDCICIVTAIGLLLGIPALLAAKTLLGIYTTDPEVIKFGILRMSVICPTYFLCGIMDVMVGQLRGLGFSVAPMIVSILGACGLRILWIYTIFQYDHTLTMLYISYPVSWFVTASVHLICYMALWKKRKAELLA